MKINNKKIMYIVIRGYISDAYVWVYYVFVKILHKNNFMNF